MQIADAKAYQRECDESLASIQNAKEALETSSNVSHVATTLEPLNQLWREIDGLHSRAGLFQQVHPDAEVRIQAERCEQSLRKIITELELSRPIYERVQSLDVSNEDPVTQRWVKHMLRDFRRAGVDRDEATRTRVKTLNEELVKLSQDFATNIRSDVRSITLESAAALEGLPEDYIEAHAPAADGTITITTDYPDAIPFMTYAEDDAARKQLYIASRSRGYPGNQSVLKALITTRHELATLLGYPSWAAYVTEDKMTGSAEVAGAFIDDIHQRAKTRAERDYAELLATLQEFEPDATEVGDWQKGFVRNRLKAQKYAFDPKTVRPYFRYSAVKQGVLALVEELFEVTITPHDLSLWHDEVEAFDIADDEGSIGRFYLDMHPRADKYKHAAAFSIQSGIEGQQLPEAALVCNFPRGDELMEHAQVETFFHEFGHLIHHLFGGKHRWVAQSGFNTEWDFVEAPSQLLEEWAWTADVLRRFATNAQGEPIPVDLIEKMRAARNLGKGLDVRHQMFYAALSFNYYSKNPTELDLQAELERLQKRYSPFEYVDQTYFQYSFGHLDGYSAIYYTYMWSQVIAQDLFSRFETEGMMNPKTAADYRSAVLAPGGSVDAREMVKNFLGREYSYDAFEAWLAE